MIIVVTSRRACCGDFLRQIAKITAAQPCAIILREKQLSEDEYYSLALSCLEICRKHHTPLVLNTFWRVALELGLTAVQLSLADFLRHKEKLATFSEMGVSVHSVTEAAAAEKAGAAYLIAGHIFPTESKKWLEPRGLDFLQEITSAVRIPVWAIGGVSPENYPAVIASGAAGACVMSAFMKTDHPAALLARFVARPRTLCSLQ